MLDDILENSSVVNLIKEIKSNDRYFNKNRDKFVIPDLYVSNELALYVLYDALLKYKIILDDIYLFDEFLEQIEKLYKKIDNIEDIAVGINKLICRMVSIKLDLKDVNSPESKVKIVEYVYDKYVVSGYYVHGFNYSYVDSIKKDGYVPEVYENYYSRFLKVNEIFKRHNKKYSLDKDFSNSSSFFTDDFVMGCYYSAYAPLFFSKFLLGNDLFKASHKDAYLIDDYDLLVGPLKRFLNDSFDSKESKYILELVKDEWDLLHRKDKKISLLLVKRDIIDNEVIDINEYLNDSDDVYTVIDRLLSSKYNKIPCANAIKAEDMEIVVFDCYYDNSKRKREEAVEEELTKYRRREANNEFLDKYGTASIFMLLGSLLISLGVIISIFMLFRG
ncbi:MAG: hypothetical protein IJI22_05875 [Bacilli bacterium]|nr:hypothetical protein [Bacilli bacterium]